MSRKSFAELLRLHPHRAISNLCAAVLARCFHTTLATLAGLLAQSAQCDLTRLGSMQHGGKTVRSGCIQPTLEILQDADGRDGCILIAPRLGATESIHA